MKHHQFPAWVDFYVLQRTVLSFHLISDIVVNCSLTSIFGGLARAFAFAFASFRAFPSFYLSWIIGLEEFYTRSCEVHDCNLKTLLHYLKGKMFKIHSDIESGLYLKSRNWLS